jgi:hypothetical protein
MSKLHQRIVRPIASALMVAFAVVSSAECMLGAHMTPEQKACCVAMQHDCGAMAIQSSCCVGKDGDDQAFVASKPSEGFVPVAALLAVLSTAPPPLIPSARLWRRVESFSASPPGIPTYLFVSSFRI